MKLILIQIKDLKEVEIEIKYAEMNLSLKKLINKIEANEYPICGIDNGRQYSIMIDDIYYIESVDKKTFIYKRDQVFRTELKLYQLLDMLKDHDFIQISKSCILNLNVLESIQPLVNSKLEATLSNGEKLNVSRTYIQAIKSALSGEGGD